MHRLARPVAAFLLSVPLPAVAAPFCVLTQAVPPQCIFFDASACNERARQLQGYCSVNESEVHVSGGLGHYCLLTSNQVSMCIYLSRDNCDRDARQQHGVCIDAPSRPESPAADPYRDIRPSMAGG
jgi:hypothetical protein